MNRDNLVGPNLKYHRNFLALQKEFPQQGNDLVVVVESENIEKNRQFVERIARKWRRKPTCFKRRFLPAGSGGDGQRRRCCSCQGKRFGRVDSKTLKDDLPFIQKFTRTTNLVSFFEQVNTAVSHGTSRRPMRRPNRWCRRCRR
jgi:hypothetical protein